MQSVMNHETRYRFLFLKMKTVQKNLEHFPRGLSVSLHNLLDCRSQDVSS